ncbi:hypothetical protein FD755_012985, partial [Muntiacus reevesi]
DLFSTPSDGPTPGIRGTSEEDPAIAGIENNKVFTILDGGTPGPRAGRVMNGEYCQETTGPTDSYTAISQVDLLHSEPETLDANSWKQEAEWKEKTIKELDEWAAEEVFTHDIEELSPGTEWELVARLCDLNPKSSKQAKDISRLCSVLISLKRGPLVH